VLGENVLMTGQRALALAGLVALAYGGACALNTSGTLPGHGGGGGGSASSSSSSGGAASSSSSASGSASSSAGGSTSSSTSASSTSTSGASSSGMVPAHCTNGKLDPMESDADCGGECPPCQAGSKCNTGADCATSQCFQGICCLTDCSTPCLSCAGKDTGGADGACLAVSSGKNDPQNRCAKGSCDGAGRCHCANATTDFDEMGVDCGGSCGKCLGVSCGSAGDCASGSCSDGVCCDVDCDAMGKCYSCALTSGPTSWTGSCTPVFSGSVAKCGSGQACSTSHVCVTAKAEGAACASNGDCASGFCFTAGMGHDDKCHALGPVGDPCTAWYQCQTQHCDIVSTHLCTP